VEVEEEEGISNGVYDGVYDMTSLAPKLGYDREHAFLLLLFS
jgi:hypothetical protein